MRLRILSDLHIEGDKDYRPSVMDGEIADVLILAGDICEISRPNILLAFLSDMSARFADVIYIMGNHEYYSGHIYESLGKLRKLVENLNNVHILHDEVIVIDGVKFIGSTMWTNMDQFSRQAMALAEQGMLDYDRIRYKNYVRLQAADTAEFHVKSMAFLDKELSADRDMPAVVITHHSPSYGSLHDRFRGNPYNPAFMSDLSNFIAKHQPDIWIHGHVHNSFDYDEHGCRIICNPRGYKASSYDRMAFGREYENPDYNDKSVAEIKISSI